MNNKFNEIMESFFTCESYISFQDYFKDNNEEKDNLVLNLINYIFDFGKDLTEIENISISDPISKYKIPEKVCSFEYFTRFKGNTVFYFEDVSMRDDEIIFGLDDIEANNNGNFNDGSGRYTNPILINDLLQLFKEEFSDIVKENNDKEFIEENSNKEKGIEQLIREICREEIEKVLSKLMNK